MCDLGAGNFNHNGMVWALFLMFKNVLVGVMLTTCDVSMCTVTCPCGPSDYKVTAPLLDPPGKVSVVAGLYLLEFFVLVFANPDMDLFNGYKMAFQQMQQVASTPHVVRRCGSAASMQVRQLMMVS